MAKIGMQLMNFREIIAEIGIYETIKKLNEMGYNTFEMSFVPTTPENIAAVKKAIDDFGIEIGAMSTALESPHPSFEALDNNYDKIINDCKILNCKILRIGMIPISYMSDKDEAFAFTKRCDAMAKQLKEHGIALHYHHHHNEFVKYDGKYFLESMRDMSEELGFELDTHWIHRGGEVPQDFIKLFEGRMKVLHLKDYVIAEPDFSQFSIEQVNPGNKDFLAAYMAIVHYAPVGEGSLKFKEIINTALEIGVEYFFIEQDDTYGEDVFECARISRENLVKMGFENLF